MNRGIYAAATAMAAAERRVETISSNLANAGAVGFKRKGVITHSFQNQMNKLMAPQVTTRESTDFSQGILRTTGGDFDLALEGEGFFAVDTAEGQVFTRNGAFHIDQDGVLQTRDGYPVAWEGSRGTIDPAGGSVSVDSGGNVGRAATTSAGSASWTSPTPRSCTWTGTETCAPTPTGSSSPPRESSARACSRTPTSTPSTRWWD
ncbi:MAG: flagellar hook basal-body protein [Planctomycetes bacterium]|nr:flagellar hook basal-body protein [Planctomycetota bacterium]